MWTPAAIAGAVASPEDRERFIVAAHHPDRLQRPPPPPGSAPDARFAQALLWNTFRTLELVSPAFWLRRFHLRLTGEADPLTPQMLRVHLWRPLPLPPVQRLDGHRPALVADVVIETEHAVWTLVAEASSPGLLEGERAAAVVDAGRWLAGVRQPCYGVIESAASAPSLGALLRHRFTRSRDSARLQSSTRGPAAPAAVSWGAIRWPDLLALLRDCRDAASLPPIERALAGHAAEWLAGVGVASASWPRLGLSQR